MTDQLLDARLRIALTSGLGPILTRRLEENLGSPLAVCQATPRQLAQIQGISRQKADLIRRALDEADVDAERKLLRDYNAHVLAISDPDYPPLLRHIPDPPPLLYVRGQLQRHDSLALAIVGARRCTHYGREQADRLAALCGQAGLTIVSGGAMGIDAAAHHAALRAGARTIAVLGCGLARCYPPSNADLFEQIVHAGSALISELPMNAPPIAENFPRRNRIISGLSLGVLVIEASNRSGALITARLASEEHNREVMALPGRVDSPASAGAHKILREGWATLVTSAADILDALGPAGQTLKAALTPDDNPNQSPSQSLDNPHLSPDQQRLLAAIPADPVSIDHLCSESGLPIGPLQGHLTHLQLIGLIERLPANRIRRRRP